jgi:EpsI family protein
VPLLGQRQEIIPARETFATFPVSIGSWTGHRDRIEDIYLDVLKLDDYVLTNYTSGVNDVVNLYVAYYATQRSGESAHSPRSCIPGGGWQIKGFEKRTQQDILINGAPLQTNRLLIQKGDDRQLVYYWFQQRGRDVTNEYLVKWFIFWDALTKNRTDGALVRLTTPLRPGEDAGEGDRRLIDLARKAVPLLKSYVPE